MGDRLRMGAFSRGGSPNSDNAAAIYAGPQKKPFGSEYEAFPTIAQNTTIDIKDDRQPTRNEFDDTTTIWITREIIR